jgi:hypothetical protein
VQGLVGSFGANAALPDASPPPKLWVASSPQSCRIPYSSSEDGIAQPIPPKFTGAGGAIRFSYCELALAGADVRSHKVDYRGIRLTRTCQGVETMIALVEGHPNIDVMVFYVIASAILAATLYYFHHKQIE